jgi:hypothetical protein
MPPIGTATDGGAPMTEYPADTIAGLLLRGAADAPAIGAPG